LPTAIAAGLCRGLFSAGGKNMSINGILDKENLGKLSFYDMLHAYGVTKDKNIPVWLPQRENKDWKNEPLEPEEIIVQLGKTKTAFQKQAVNWNNHVTVIFRDTPYKRLEGEYRTVFHDKDSCLMIHAKADSPLAQGTVPQQPNNDTVSWVSGFAATEEEAVEKANKYKEKAGL
jgi:hypothetical protein